MYLLSLALIFNQATITTSIDPALPSWLERSSSTYQECLFGAIDREYESGRFSEKTVLSECARVRRAQMKAAETALAGATGTKNGKAVIGREFVRLDHSVWTIVDHLRERHRIKPSGS